MAEEIFYWVALSLVPGVGSVLFKRLLDQFKTPGGGLQGRLERFVRVEGVGKKVAEEIQKGPAEKKTERELRLVQEAGGTLLTLADEHLSHAIKGDLRPTPFALFKGRTKGRGQSCTLDCGKPKDLPYGRWITEKISQEIVRHGITIVSGMARGIDSVAHGGAISGGGRTLAVLGCGIDVIYPPENRTLFGQIIDHGAVLSEFPMGSRPEGIHFPRRNRIISGLSIGVVVVQASAESGSLITAEYALEQGREVFAIPGNVGAEGSRGTNRLIKEGAKLVESSEDILEEILPQWKRNEGVLRSGSNPLERVCSEEEKIVYQLLSESPLHIDGIIRESRLDPGKVSSLLLDLELKGLITQWPGKCFTKK